MKDALKWLVDINVKYSMTIIGAIVGVAGLLASGQIPLDQVVSPSTLAAVKQICQDIVVIGGFIMSGHGASSIVSPRADAK